MSDFTNIAYGFLWLDDEAIARAEREAKDNRLCEARAILLSVIGPDGQIRGIEQARLLSQLRDPPPEAVRRAIDDE